jgi:hypothetical protein
MGEWPGFIPRLHPQTQRPTLVHTRGHLHTHRGPSPPFITQDCTGDVVMETRGGRIPTPNVGSNPPHLPFLAPALCLAFISCWMRESMIFFASSTVAANVPKIASMGK